MEDTTEFNVPNFDDNSIIKGEEEPKKKFNPIDNLRKRKETKEIMDTRPRLPRTNRTINCIFCEEEKILNPDQYQSYYDYWGDEDKIIKNFSCKPCEMKMKENPIKFWYAHSDSSKKLLRNLKTAFDLFNLSEGNIQDITSLQNMCDHFLAVESFCSRNNFEFIIEDRKARGMKISNVPLVGTVIYKPYDNKYKIQV